MKEFKDIIQKYLEQRAAEDVLFAPKFSNPKKNIDKCCRYILGEARKRGNEVVMDDSEVYGLAVHYYDEDDIKVSGASNCKVSSRPQATPAKPLSQQPTVLPLKRGKAKREENKLQLSLFD
ncbi:MAG: hypothetical protein HP046_16200 [Parabacteroides sp.]|nr:hypothetical protein [Parabacteroides sp.]